MRISTHARNGIIAYVIVYGAFAAMLFAAVYFFAPVQAAQPAPPTVTPCDLVNTATLSGGGVIEVFRCLPDGGAPYLLDSFGFMKDAD